MPTIKINKTTNPHNSNTKKTQKIPQFVINYNPSQKSLVTKFYTKTPKFNKI